MFFITFPGLIQFPGIIDQNLAIKVYTKKSLKWLDFKDLL